MTFAPRGRKKIASLVALKTRFAFKRRRFEHRSRSRKWPDLVDGRRGLLRCRHHAAVGTYYALCAAAPTTLTLGTPHGTCHHRAASPLHARHTTSSSSSAFARRDLSSLQTLGDGSSSNNCFIRTLLLHVSRGHEVHVYVGSNASEPRKIIVR